MRVYNKSQRAYQHNKYLLRPGADLDVPDKIAKQWLATGEIVKYVDPEEAEKAKAEAAKKQAELENENKELKAELAKLNKELEKAKAEAAKSNKDEN